MLTFTTAHAAAVGSVAVVGSTHRVGSWFAIGHQAGALSPLHGVLQ